MRPVPSAPLVGPFAERVLARDLPDLPPERLEEAVGFTIRRVDGLPSVMRVGVLAVAAVVRTAMLPGRGLVVGLLARTSAPILGEYVRLIRSLGYAFVWETWPDTQPSGAAG